MEGGVGGKNGLNEFGIHSRVNMGSTLDQPGKTRVPLDHDQGTDTTLRERMGRLDYLVNDTGPLATQ